MMREIKTGLVCGVVDIQNASISQLERLEDQILRNGSLAAAAQEKLREVRSAIASQKMVLAASIGC